MSNCYVFFDTGNRWQCSESARGVTSKCPFSASQVCLGHHAFDPYQQILRWGFPKSWGSPQSSSISTWHVPEQKPSILGYPHCWKALYQQILRWPNRNSKARGFWCPLLTQACQQHPATIVSKISGCPWAIARGQHSQWHIILVFSHAPRTSN